MLSYFEVRTLSCLDIGGVALCVWVIQQRAVFPTRVVKAPKAPHLYSNKFVPGSSRRALTNQQHQQTHFDSIICLRKTRVQGHQERRGTNNAWKWKCSVLYYTTRSFSMKAPCGVLCRTKHDTHDAQTHQAHYYSIPAPVI